MDKEKEKLILEHIALADKIAMQMFPKLKNKYSLDELKSSAYLGLIDAAEKYEINNNKPFKNFARKRIKGSILDEVKDDKRYNVKRGVPHEQPIQSLNSTTCKDGEKTVQFIELVQAKEDYLNDLLIKNEIEKMLLCLDHREKEIVTMYYFRNLTQQEISEFIGLKQPAVSKIIKRAIKKIKGCLTTGK